MRVYTKEQITGKSKRELQVMLDGVKVSDLTNEEKAANVELLEVEINGDIDKRNIQILDDIKAGEADTSDMNGH